MKRRGRYSCVDPRHPEAAGVCDRGGEVRRRRDLLPEMMWSGGKLIPTGFLSCRQHMDLPNPQFGGQRALPPDPVPVRDPRPINDPPQFYQVPLLDAQGVPLLDATGSPLWVRVPAP